MLDSRSSPVLFEFVVAMNPSIVLFLATFSLLQKTPEAVLPHGHQVLSPCGFRVNGAFYPESIVVDDTTTRTDIELISNGSCGTLLAIAIGGGGSTGSAGTGSAGSGSGYIEYTELSITSNQVLRAEIGGARVATELTDLSDGSTLLTANPGEDGGTDFGVGGSGFSGGGADNLSSCTVPQCLGGRGGQDGADGEDTDDFDGGIGSGIDISSIPLKNVVIR